MFSLINIEWIKMKRSLFYKILLLFLIIGIVGSYIYIFSNTMGADEVSEILDNSLASEKEQLAHLELLEQEEGDSFDQSSRHALNQYREWVPAHQAQIEGIASSDWTKWANGNIITRNFSETNLPEYWEHKYQSRFTLETHKSMLEWMRDRNIQPLWPNNFWLTQYDVYFDEGIEPIVRNDFEKRHSSSGSYFNYHLFEKLFTLIGIFFFIFLFSDIVTKEGEGRNGPINLLRTMPLHRLAVLTSKFGAVLLMTIGTLAGIFLFATLLGTVFDRFGDWDYPTLIYGENYTYEWVPVSLFLIKSAWLFFLVLIFSYSLLFFFSLLTNRAIIALGITLTLLVLGVKWAEQSVLTTNTHLFPLHYINVFPIISNKFAVLHDNFAFSYQNGVISLAISSIILLFFTYVLSVYRYRTRG